MRGTVLVVEQESGLRQVLVHVLGDAHYEVLVAAGERDAASVLERAAPCLVLLDAKLPGGATTTILGRAGIPGTPRACPVVLLSPAQLTTSAPGVVGVLRKPFEMTRMLGLVRTFCPSPPLDSSAAPGSSLLTA